MIVYMSHKKEEQQNRNEETTFSLEKQQQKVDEALDDTKHNLKRTTDAAIKEVSRYTKAFNDYQEQSIQTIADVATSYVDTQKEILRSFQASLSPFTNNAINVFKDNYNNYFPYYFWPYLKNIADVYGIMINSLADNTMVTA